MKGEPRFRPGLSGFAVAELEPVKAQEMVQMHVWALSLYVYGLNTFGKTLSASSGPESCLHPSTSAKSFGRGPSRLAPLLPTPSGRHRHRTLSSFDSYRQHPLFSSRLTLPSMRSATYLPTIGSILKVCPESPVARTRLAYLGSSHNSQFPSNESVHQQMAVLKSGLSVKSGRHVSITFRMASTPSVGIVSVG